MLESVAFWKERGFNLLELMVTLAIAGIVLALAFPSMRSLLGDNHMVTTTNEFVSSIHTARSEAVKRGDKTGLCPVADPPVETPVCSGSVWSSGWIAFIDENGNGERDEPADEVLLQMEAREPGFEFVVDGTEYTDLIYFSPDGVSITPDEVPVVKTINVTYPDTRKRVISVSSNGRVSTKVIKPDDSSGTEE